jgi:hypothetical protein
LTSRLPHLGALIAVLAFPAASGADELACPPTYSKPPDSASSLVGTVKEGAKLHAVQVISGRPGEEAKEAPATLAPDSEVRRGKEIVQTWPLSPDEIEEGVILVCYYAGSKGYLRFQLKPGMAECTARLTGGNGRFRVIAAGCR